MGTPISPERLRPDELPVQFGRYRLTRILGEGGMARVFQATLDGPSGFTKQVALKVIRPQNDSLAEDLARRFSIEARLGGLLRHPNVVDIYDFGTVNNQPFIAMELIDGVTIRQMVRQLGPLPPSVLLEITSQACDGLIHAHGLTINGELAGLVHRDLTPGNIMVSHMGVTKVMDFGLARIWSWSDEIEAAEALHGTPAYMSPEQTRQSTTGAASDIFSLGAVVYLMATGQKLFDAPTPIAALIRVQQVEDTLHTQTFTGRLDRMVPGLSSVLHRCLRSEVVDRYATASELREQIELLRSSLGSASTLRSFIETEVLGGDTQFFGHGAGSADLTQSLAVDEEAEHSTASTLHHLVTPRTNVGEERTGFIGRAADLSDIRATVAAGHRLVTIMGPGGSGKTRLAHRFVKELLEEPEPRWAVWWCDLSTSTDLEGIVQAVAAALDVQVSAVPTTAEQVTRLGEAMAQSENIIIVLDNFDQVADCASASVGMWLETAPQARFLVTSQVRLKLAGEVCQRLGALNEPEAVELFLERARRAGGKEVVLNRDTDALLELLRRLDYLPLAIELAAAHTSVLSPAQIVERLSSRFQLLLSKRPDGAQRHQSLEQTLDWSWDLLEPWEKACLAQLSVFAGSFRMEDAEGVVDYSAHPDAPWIVFVVEVLVDRSLVHTVPALGQNQQIRFRISESVREYAGKQLGDNGLSTRRRHAEWYAQYGDLDYVLELRTRGGDARRQRLILDRPNLLSAANCAIENNWMELASKVGHITMTILSTLGPLSAVMDLSKRLLAMPLSDPQRYLVLVATTWSKVESDYDGTVQDLLEALTLLDSMEPSWQEAACLSNLGAVYLRGNNLDAAQEALERSDELCVARGADVVRATTLINLGIVHANKGQHEVARDHYAQGMDLAEAQGNLRAACQAHINLGDAYRVFGEHERARTHIDRGIAIAQSLGFRRKHAILLINHAEIDLEIDDLSRTDQHLDTAMSLVDTVGEPRLKGVISRLRAMYLMRMGDADAAWESIGQAEQFLDVYPNSPWMGDVLCTRADFELNAGRVEDARATFARIEKILEHVGQGTDVAFDKHAEQLRNDLNAQDSR